MTNLFKNAKFGKAYKTRDGRKAIFHNRKLTRILGKGLCECFHLVCDKLDREIECYSDGRESSFHDDILDIVSEWTIDEEELEDIAIDEGHELSRKYGYDNSLEDENIFIDGFKEGYRKAIEL